MRLLIDIFNKKPEEVKEICDKYYSKTFKWEIIYSEAQEIPGGRIVYAGVFRIEDSKEPRLIVREIDNVNYKTFDFEMRFNAGAKKHYIYFSYEFDEDKKAEGDLFLTELEPVSYSKVTELEIKLDGSVSYSFRSGDIPILRNALIKFLEATLEFLKEND